MARTLGLILGRVKGELRFDHVHVRDEHPATAVSPQAKPVERLLLGPALAQESQVRLPLVPDDLAAAEAANWDDHVFEYW